jgi:FkbM family methyltransferase
MAAHADDQRGAGLMDPLKFDPPPRKPLIEPRVERVNVGYVGRVPTAEFWKRHGIESTPIGQLFGKGRSRVQIIKTDGLIFECETDIERSRAETLLTKEPGTIEWLRTLPEGAIFYDVGANIGAYTLFAARQVGPRGRVYAFEPHIINARSLLRNVAANGFTDRVRILTCALGDSDDVYPFCYRALEAGSSGSQLGHCTDENGKTFEPVLVEMKHVARADRLPRHLDLPQYVKIDVDGNDLIVLGGMAGLLQHAPPVSVQVEVHKDNLAGIEKFMNQHDYILASRHYTANGQRAIAKGAEPLAIPHNAIYVRAA